MSKTSPDTRAGGGDQVTEKREQGLVVRDSFTMPLADYELIGALKQRCLRLGFALKKSELLRAGLAALQGQTDESLAQVVAAVENVKTGRPPSGKRKAKKQMKGGKQ